jgi:hypothetical protein
MRCALLASATSCRQSTRVNMILNIREIWLQAQYILPFTQRQMWRAGDLIQAAVPPAAFLCPVLQCGELSGLREVPAADSSPPQKPTTSYRNRTKSSKGPSHLHHNPASGGQGPRWAETHLLHTLPTWASTLWCVSADACCGVGSPASRVQATCANKP